MNCLLGRKSRSHRYQIFEYFGKNIYKNLFIYFRTILYTRWWQYQKKLINFEESQCINLKSSTKNSLDVHTQKKLFNLLIFFIEILPTFLQRNRLVVSLKLWIHFLLNFINLFLRSIPIHLLKLNVKLIHLWFLVLDFLF